MARQMASYRAGIPATDPYAPAEDAPLFHIVQDAETAAGLMDVWSAFTGAGARAGQKVAANGEILNEE